MSLARDILNNRSQLLSDMREGKYEIRFKRTCVAVSDIPEQFYCEKKLDLRYEHGEIETEAMMQGTEGHENIDMLAKPVSYEQLVKKSLQKRKEPLMISNFAVNGIYKDVPILGRPDELWVKQGVIDLIIENKYSLSFEPYLTYKVQAQLYCFLLEEMGYDTSTSKYQLRIFKPRCRDCPELSLRSCLIFSSNCEHHSCDIAEVKSYILPYNREDTIKKLDWALDYWLGLRDPIPTTNKVKCNKCEYREYCQ